MRRTILLLLATMALAPLLVGGVATSKQRLEESTSSLLPTSNKSGGDVSIQSTTVKASFASGSGANRLSVKVSNHGNLLSFESPATQEAVFSGREGYAVCTAEGATIHGHDTGDVEAGFGTPTFSQPTAGAFPLTVTRKTMDGKFQLKQVWNKPDATEKDVTVTMTIKNLSSAAIGGVVLSRSGDFDVGDTSPDQGARTADSAWQWDDPSSTAAEPARVGTMLTALTFGRAHFSLIEPRNEWTDITRSVCSPGGGLPTPTAVQDLAMRVFYNLGTLNAGQSKTVKFEYRRM